MLLLTGSSDILRVVTGSAANVTVCPVAMDVLLSSGVVSPANLPNVTIATATTTTIAAGVALYSRNIKGVFATNNHATNSTQFTLQRFDGTTSADIESVTLLPGETFLLTAEGDLSHKDSQGGTYTYAPLARGSLGITGTIAETIPREICPEVNTVVPTASGTLFMQAIYLTAGQLVSNITVSSATTAAGTPTAGRVGLYDGSRNLRATSADQTTTAWAANTVKTLAMTTPYRVPTSGLYYIGFYMTATTVITMKGGTAKTGGQLASAVPILHGTSSTGLTTTLPDPAAAITAGLVTIYAGIT